MNNKFLLLPNFHYRIIYFIHWEMVRELNKINTKILRKKI